MPCRIFYRLLERLEPLEAVYTGVVETVMGHPRHRETAAQLRASADPLETCEALAWLLELVEGRRVCIIGPRAGGQEGGSGCEVLAGPEAAVLWAASRGVRLHYTTGDGDLDPLLASSIQAYTRVYILHLHGDNWWVTTPWRIAGFMRAYSSQVRPAAPNPVLAPLGYTDGDRAAVLAMALEAESIVFQGFWGQPLARHKSWEGSRGVKALKLKLARRVVEEAARYMGYKIRMRSLSGEPLWLEKA
ncbi:hypothetical protein [Aeropyrum pernix]|uniref:hypothetical protein n=1 Tax=Aeropyrum pernix TaxID=56636 RepID=UPI0011E4FB86|nr:hypothetical protein [Aeropyrum pernix]